MYNLLSKVHNKYFEDDKLMIIGDNFNNEETIFVIDRNNHKFVELLEFYSSFEFRCCFIETLRNDNWFWNKYTNYYEVIDMNPVTF